jgi:hypothetical protein
MVRGGQSCGGRGGFFPTAKEKTAMRKLFDESAFFEASQHLLQNVALALFYLERAGDFLDGNGVISKLQKT